MKIRSDFVTNSSSSSFIIGRREEIEVDVNFVYQKIKSFYVELFMNVKRLQSDINSNNVKDIIYKTDEHGFSYFKFKEKLDWNVEKLRRKEILTNYGIDLWDSYSENFYNWLHCENYNEYEEFWVEKKTNKLCAPFTITDYLEPKTVKWLHWFGDGDSELMPIDINNDELGWYFSYLDDTDPNLLECQNCQNLLQCNKNNCIISIETDGKKFPNERACLYKLGRVCIHSESGYIPSVIVDKLRKISEYSCNHMG